MITKAKILKCLSIAAEISGIIIHIKDKPNAAEILALTGKSIDITARIYNELFPGYAISSWAYFEDGNWRSFPKEIYSVISRDLYEKEVLVKRPSNGGDGSYLAKYNGIKVGYIVRGESEEIVYFCVDLPKRKLFKEEVNKSFWEKYPSGCASLDRKGFIEDKFDLTGIKETRFIKKLENHVKKFIDIGEHCGILLKGEPGTGKTVAIKYVTQSLGLKTLRIPISTFSGRTWLDGDLDIKTILTIASPDALIIDDIDRVPKQSQCELLDFMDNSQSIKFYFATANETKNMIEPLLRPGRLDEHFKVKTLEREVLELLLGDKPYIDKMLNWPVAYIDYFKKYYKAFGEEESIKKIKELDKRLKKEAEDAEE